MASYYESINFANELQKLYNDTIARSKDDLFENYFKDGWNNLSGNLYNTWFGDVYKKYTDMLQKAPKYYRENVLNELWALANQYNNNLTNWYNTNMKDYAPGKLPGDDVSGGSLTEPNKSNENVTSSDQGANAALSDAQKAIQTGLQQQEEQSQEAARNAAAAGVSKSQAGSLADQATQGTQSQNVGNMYASNSAQRSSTQADYLEKMQNVANLANQANLVDKSTGAAALSGALSGGAAGLQMGMSLVSDERMKQPPKRGMLNSAVDEKEIRKAIKQFKELYARLQELKKSKQEAK